MKMRICPEHLGTRVTPKDTECHNHESRLQQRMHNLHCRVIKRSYSYNLFILSTTYLCF